MTRRALSTGSPFEERVGYARAVVMSGAGGDWCFVAGTTGYDYARMAMPDDPAEQARNTLATIATTLEEAGFALGDVVRARYYLTDRAHRAAIEPVLGATFRPILPAATMVICDLAAPEMKVEIEVDAYRPA